MSHELRSHWIGISHADRARWREAALDAGFRLVDETSDVDVALASPEGLSAALESSKRESARPAVLVLDARATAESALSAMRAGAFDVAREDRRELAAAFERVLARRGAASNASIAAEERDRLRRFFEEGPVIVFRWRATPGWPVEYASPNTRNCFGVEAADFISGRVPYATVVHPEDIQRVADEVRAHTERGVRGFDQDYRIVRPSGEVRRLYDHTLIVRDASGAVTHYEGYVLDQTEFWEARASREAMVERLWVAQKLESLGLMAGGVAHDFNNILTAILGNLDLSLARIPSDDPHHSPLCAARDAAERAADLSQQMLAYAGRCQIDRRTLDLGELARGLSTLLASMVSKKVRLDLQIEPGAAVVEGDASQLQQIVLNLVVNGAEACGDRPGCVTVRIGARDGQVELSVRDDGAGMDERVKRSIFDPFFTTKSQGRGLGLSAVQGLVRAHGGEIDVDSAPGTGTTFRVRLPRATGSPQPVAEARVECASLGRHRILVVDDEHAVSSVAVRILEGSGCSAEAVSSGPLAIERVRASPQAYDAVLLDRTMPEMDGLEALSHLRAIRPDLPVVLTSGFQQSELSSALSRRPATLFLGKPYTLATLTDAIRRALAPA